MDATVTDFMKIMPVLLDKIRFEARNYVTSIMPTQSLSHGVYIIAVGIKIKTRCV